jgi:bacteriocin biosynthesis cyclodehydratase domain-containing protein
MPHDPGCAAEPRPCRTIPPMPRAAAMSGLSVSPVTLRLVRPALKPGLLPVWRDRNTLQIGIDSRRAVALTGMAGVARVINLLDGSRDRAQVIRAAADHGIPAETADRVLTLLAAAGTLDDFPAGTLRLLPSPLRARLAAELATASLAHRDGDGGARTLARRLAAQVCVHGGGRVGSGIASLLTTSGIGHVTHADSAREAARPPSAAQPGPNPPGPPRPAAPPAGDPQPSTKSSGRLRPGPPRAGLPRPGPPRPGPPRPGPPQPDLAVLVGRHPPELRASLMREQIPHLAAAADEAIGIVGPLVIPGRTACLRCMDLARADRDPAWPLILAQLAGREPDPLACDAPLAAAVAAHAAAQALAFIDRPAETGAVANGTLELVLPSWQWRRRTWPPHPGCDCGSR